MRLRLDSSSRIIAHPLRLAGPGAPHQVQPDWRLTSAAIFCNPHKCRHSRPWGDSLDAATSQVPHSSEYRSQRGRIQPGRRSASASSCAGRQPASVPAQDPLIPRTMRALLRSARAMCHARSSTRRSSGVGSVLRFASSARSGKASRTPKFGNADQSSGWAKPASTSRNGQPASRRRAELLSACHFSCRPGTVTR